MDKMKVLANDGISNEGKKALETAGFTVITDKVDQNDLIDYVNKNKVEIILVRSATTVRKEVIDACPSIRLVGRGGVGMDNIDVAYAREKGITVINTPASSSQSVAELVMGHLLSSARFLYDSYKNMETGDFSALKKNYAKGVELRGKTLGIVGFGRIGQSLASYALGCGMNVIGVNREVEKVTIPVHIGGNELAINVECSNNLNDVLSKVDYLSIHVPKQPNGEAVIGKAEFAAMKKGMRIVNAARGGVIDEDALLEALENGTVAVAALDVFENEPNPRKDLLNHPRIACTPHIGAATVEAQDRIGEG
jgi:D-3-phosphoglycerate dehydrogenase